MQLTPVQVDQVLRKNNLLIGIKNFEKLTKNFSDLSYDSRNAKEDDLFVAKGKDFELYINQAIKNKIAAIVTVPTDVEIKIPHFVVNDIDKALAVLSAAYFDYPNKKLTIIGITGTKGKTSTAYMAYSLLKDITNNKTALFSTIDRITGPKDSDINKSDLTTPESYQLFKDISLAVENNMTFLVMEVSSQAYLRKRVFGIEFEVGVFLNISADHIGQNEHKDFEEYLNCKLELFENSQNILINQQIDHFQEVMTKANQVTDKSNIYLFGGQNADIDDQIVSQEITGSKFSSQSKLVLFENSQNILINQQIAHFQEAITKANQVTDKSNIYLFGGQNADIDYQIVSQEITGSKFSLQSRRLNLDLQANIDLPGEFNVQNAVAAISIVQLVTNKINQDNIQTLSKLTIPGRMVVIDRKPMAIVDYAHNGASLEKLLEFVEQHYNQMTLVIGATGDKGQNRRQGIAKAINKFKPRTILTSDDPGFEDPQEIAEEIAESLEKVDYQIETNRELAIKKAVEITDPDDVVIIAGKGDDHYQKIQGDDTKYPGDIFIVENLL